jgi:hypothetical protein
MHQTLSNRGRQADTLLHDTRPAVIQMNETDVHYAFRTDPQAQHHDRSNAVAGSPDHCLAW